MGKKNHFGISKPSTVKTQKNKSLNVKPMSFAVSSIEEELKLREKALTQEHRVNKKAAASAEVKNLKHPKVKT